jgi:hypothetical protein
MPWMGEISFLGFTYRMVVELIFTLSFVVIILRNMEKHAVAREAVTQTLIGSTNGNAEVLLPIL